MKLEGLTAVITGSSGKLGGATASALAEAGCRCVCHYHTNRQRAEELVSQIAGMGQEAIAVGADLTEEKEIKRLFDAAAAVGRVRILVNSVSVFEKQPLSDVTLDNARDVMDVNLTGPILACAQFARVVLSGQSSESENPVGKIINLVDVGGIRPWANYVVYCASKGGLIAATKSMAKELAPAICVNGVAPGVIAWPGRFSEEDKKRQLAFIPAGRTGEMSEFISAVIFLLENDYITGQVLNVDGGRCI
jgi:NAD(P)-dependent dehydrogenase (short-subunit alcohol dehydrogenase family)